jgi:hypothetical protein
MKTLTIAYEEENESLVLTALEELPVSFDSNEAAKKLGKKLWFPTYSLEPNQMTSVSRKEIYGNDGR